MMGFYIVFSFEFWLIDFQMEYLGDDLYLNFYLTGLVLVLSAKLSIWLYPRLGLRNLLQMVALVMLPAISFIIAVQNKWVSLGDGLEENGLFEELAFSQAILIVSLAC